MKDITGIKVDNKTDKIIEKTIFVSSEDGDGIRYLEGEFFKDCEVGDECLR